MHEVRNDRDPRWNSDCPDSMLGEALHLLRSVNAEPFMGHPAKTLRVVRIQASKLSAIITLAVDEAPRSGRDDLKELSFPQERENFQYVRAEGEGPPGP
ncbi:MAG TPA: hypothetical protein VNC50_03010 [Planctomycetia bacterium]|nr:hypothetical protein [Planctomycetia bacterium]